MNYIISLETTGMDCKNDILTKIALIKAGLNKYHKKLFKRYRSFKTDILEDVKNFIKFSYKFFKNFYFFQDETEEKLYRAVKPKLKNPIIETLDCVRKLYPEENNTLEFYLKSMILKIKKNILFKALMVMPDLFRILKNKSIY